MMRRVFDQHWAWHAATDTGNRHMRAAGRIAWIQEDYQAAASEFSRLWPLEMALQEARKQYYLHLSEAR